MTLTLMRHPHIDFATQRCLGQTDVDLSFEGKSSLKSLAGEACLLRPDQVISSDLKRCRCLAEEIAAQLCIRPVFDLAWREIDFGFWENRTWEGIRGEETKVFSEWVADFVTTAPPGGESFLQLQKRILSAIDAMLRDWSSPNVLVVTHAGVMRAAYAAFANLPLSRAFDYQIPYGGMFHLRRVGNAFAIEAAYPFSAESTA